MLSLICQTDPLVGKVCSLLKNILSYINSDLPKICSGPIKDSVNGVDDLGKDHMM
jgi:hypothetical protein